MNRIGERIQEIVEQIDGLQNPAARALVQECMQSVLSFYGHGLERVLHIIKHAGIGAQPAYDELLHDNLVRGLLLIHGLHPIPLEQRLREALDKIRPYLQSHGGNVDLLGVENDFARLRLQGACKTCPSSAVTLELAVRHAVEEACPDLQGFHVDGIAAASQPTATPRGNSRWITLDHAADIPDSTVTRMEAANLPLALCRVNGTLYAYGDHCPVCNLPLHLGKLESDGTLFCGTGHRFLVREAGRGLNGSHLDPLPLIVERGVVKVALATPEPSEPESVPA
jgi:Fe-S cluster biogenesis protein NfuA/nitrite reductase/ring-hydroxylating ferredoxin subunit